MRGGLQLTAHKQHSARPAIVTLAAPREAILPLNQHAGFALTPSVRAGERVSLGQTIASGEAPWSADLHAPVSGVVTVIEPRPSTPLQGQPALSVVIENDGEDRRATPAAAEDWQQLSPAALCRRLAQGGIVGLGGAVFSTAKKLAAERAIDCLILNGAECEPYITCDDRLMRERAALVVLGAQIFLHACNAQHCVIAVEDDKPEALQAVRAAVATARDRRIETRSVEITYPTGDEAQLIRLVLGTEVPRGGLPADLGVICQNVGTAAAAAQWLQHGLPLISRIMTVTGGGVAKPGNLEARLGTPLKELIAACGGYSNDATALIMGGSMMGLTLPDDELPVVKATNCLIAASAADLYAAHAELPCIRCGQCMDVCPAGLLPQQLHAHLLNGDTVALAELGLNDCIECGCCDYVCPSRIPLVSRFRAAKRAHA